MSKKIIFITILLLTSYFLILNSAQAQEIKDELILTWSANTYIPFDYPGKALPVYGSLITVAVIPTSKLTFNLETLNYNWFLDGERQIANSGQNRQEFVFRVTTTASNEHLIKVQIKNKEGTISLEISTNIKIVSPQIVLYWLDQETNKPGIAQVNWSWLSPGQERTFVALPYFFEIQKINQLKYQWSFENQLISKAEKPNFFTLKIAQGELERPTSRELSILVENPKNRIQRTSNKIEIMVK